MSDDLEAFLWIWRYENRGEVADFVFFDSMETGVVQGQARFGLSDSDVEGHVDLRSTLGT